MSHDIKPSKLVLLGESHVGKTCILEKYIYNFDENITESIKGINYSKTLEFQGKKLKFQIYTVEREKFRVLLKIFYKKANIIIFNL